MLGLSLGGGEFLLGPTAFVRYGLSLLWITLVSVYFQTIFNTELMRYTLATGEPAFTGFMRTRPSRAFWSWFYVDHVPAAGGMAVFRRAVRRRDVFPGDAASRHAGRCVDDLSNRRRHVSSLHRSPDAGAPHRTHARAAQLGDGGRHPRRLPCCSGSIFVPGRDLDGRRSRAWPGSICPAEHSVSCLPMPTFCCWPRWRAIRAPEAW